jgi:hypothetical protein
VSTGTGVLSPELRRTEREADHSLLSSAEVKNMWSYTSTPRIRLHGVYRPIQMTQVALKWRTRLAGYVTRMADGKGAYRVLAGKLERRRSLGRRRHKWENNIKMDLRQMGWGHGLDRSGSGWGQVAGCCECGSEPSCSIKSGKFLE